MFGQTRFNRAVGRYVLLGYIVAITGVVALIGLAAGESKPSSSVGDGTTVQSRAVEVAREPSPRLSAEDVVRAQMSALAGEDAIMKRIERCYRFASPANREHTGPIEHFAQMVQAPQYAPLLAAKHFLVGQASQEEDGAFVLVTTVDSAGELTLFRFFLSKQTKAPYADCWMTDAVLRVGTFKKSGDSEKPLNDGEPI